MNLGPASLFSIVLVACPLAAQQLELRSVRGRIYKQAELQKHEVIVLAWTGLDCPMSKVYRPRLRDIAKEFVDESVQFFLIDSCKQDRIHDVRRTADSVMLGFPAVRDAGGRLAKRFSVTRTTEVLVLNKKLEVVYRGAVDDQYGYRKLEGGGVGSYRKDAPTKNYLKDAVTALLDGKKLPKATEPMGCAIGKWVREKAAAPAARVTFHEHVEPILQRSCQRCHHDGGGAPFALVSYGDVESWADMVQEVVDERRMPPWSADPKIGKWKNDPRLSNKEIGTIASWVEQGAPRGDPARAPEPLTFKKGWQFEPDIVYDTKPFRVPATGRIRYRYVRIRTKFAEDRWVTKAQVKHDFPEIVHHTLILLQESRASRRRPDRPFMPEFSVRQLFDDVPRRERRRHMRRLEKYTRDLLTAGGGIHGYFLADLPGGAATVMPEGRALFLPKGATLILQIHYSPNGRERENKTRLALKFTKERPKEILNVWAATSVTFEIPPRVADHPVTPMFRFPRSAKLLFLRPHMHLRGKSVRYVLVMPDGSRETLLNVPYYDFDWQHEYVLAKPRQVPRGAMLRVESIFDNSKANPYNPDPSKLVTFGLQSEDEMMIGYFGVIWGSQ